MWDAAPMLSSPSPGRAQPCDCDGPGEPREQESIDFMAVDGLGFHPALFDGPASGPVDISELSESLMTDGGHDEIAPHTTAYFQLEDIVRELNAGSLSADEAFFFLEELNGYLDERLKRFAALEDCGGEVEHLKGELVSGLTALKGAVNRAGWLIREKGHTSLGDEILREAEGADDVLGQAAERLRRTAP